MMPKIDVFTPWARRIMQRTPRLFGDAPWDLTQTLVGFGFDCGPGWFPLIERTLGSLSRIARDDGLDQMRIVQVKEKYGTLRIYLSGSNDRANAVVDAAEALSARICDLCGGAVLAPPARTGWIVTRCATCVAGKASALKALQAARMDCSSQEQIYRVLILADLHLDLWMSAKEEPLPGLDAEVFWAIDMVILAGDLTNKGHVRWTMALEWLAERINPRKIWAFPGNHDAYGGTIDKDEKLRDIIEGFGGHYAQKAEIRLGGRRFLCATLWTDMRLGGALDANMAKAAKEMNDHRYIRMAERGYSRLRPVDTVALHRTHRNWLEAKLAEPFEGETIVVSHHAPHPECLPPAHALPAAYASDLNDLIQRHQPSLWAHGHLHQHMDVDLGHTRILNVSLGYPKTLDPDQPRNDPLNGLISWVGPKKVLDW
jgi:Icc-related predicted phosphoesterase